MNPVSNSQLPALPQAPVEKVEPQVEVTVTPNIPTVDAPLTPGLGNATKKIKSTKPAKINPEKLVNYLNIGLGLIILALVIFIAVVVVINWKKLFPTPKASTPTPVPQNQVSYPVSSYPVSY